LISNLAGLQSRLSAAEKFLGEQTKQLVGIDAKRESIQSQLKQMQVVDRRPRGR